MRSKRASPKASAERVVKDIRRKTQRQCSAKAKIKIVLESLLGDDSIAVWSFKRTSLFKVSSKKRRIICLRMRNGIKT